MKRTNLYRYLPLRIALLGGVGLVLRLALYALEEPSGLLPQGHPLHIASLLLSGVAIAAVLILVKSLGGSAEYRENFPASKAAGFGAIAAGALMLPCAMDILHQTDNTLSLFEAGLALLCVPCLTITGFCRLKGRPTHFLFHAALCLYFAIHMICQYRLWSGRPQIETYMLPLLACVFLALTGYYRTAFDVGMGSRRKLLFCGLLAGFFCICSLGSNTGWFYLAGSIWSLTCLCVIQPPRKREVSEDVSA